MLHANRGGDLSVALVEHELRQRPSMTRRTRDGGGSESVSMMSSSYRSNVIPLIRFGTSGESDNT
jgi:hypothetical protein